MQKEVANAIGIHPSNYPKMGKGDWKSGIKVIDKPDIFLGLTIIKFVHPNNKLPKEIKKEHKTATGKAQLIAQLREDDKNAIYRIIERMLTKNVLLTLFE